MIISLNVEEYESQIGKLPKEYLKCCTVDALNESDAITKYWHKVGGTGEFKRREKLRKSLFNFRNL
jgi:hypothetical protein